MSEVIPSWAVLCANFFNNTNWGGGIASYPAASEKPDGSNSSNIDFDTAPTGFWVAHANAVNGPFTSAQGMLLTVSSHGAKPSGTAVWNYQLFLAGTDATGAVGTQSIWYRCNQMRSDDQVIWNKWQLIELAGTG